MSDTHNTCSRSRYDQYHDRQTSHQKNQYFSHSQNGPVKTPIVKISDHMIALPVITLTLIGLKTQSTNTNTLLDYHLTSI